jgi:beta-glucosidase-like glycosyl hydrolase
MAFFLLASFHCCFAQHFNKTSAVKWADSVYQSLNDEERIGQLIVTRLSTIDMKTMKITLFYDQVMDYVKKYNIGSVCIFQGGPEMQATMMNAIKKIAKTPVLFSIDGEWGLGQRLLDSIIPLPKQMMLGAINNPSIIYQYGKLVASQCKRMGIQMNYAPVADVNNNPNNPIINDRSFGEDKIKVANFAVEYMKGMQHNGILACAKHFPGHGDVAVDSHLDLPVINKSMSQIDSLELFPFKKLFKEGVGSTMIAHLYIPAIDSSKNKPTSLSKKAIQDLLRIKLNYDGLTITDGLEMQGVKKFYPDGEASVMSLIAGNDLLCLLDSVPMVINKIKKAILEKRLSWEDIEWHCKRVLMTKYAYVLNHNDTIKISNLSADINKEVPGMRKLIAENAITLLSKKENCFFPLSISKNKDSLVYIGVGINKENTFSNKMKADYSADIIYFDFNKKNKDSIKFLLDSIVRIKKKIVIGIHQIARPPANNFNMSKEAIDLITSIQEKTTSITFLFGNAYAAKNWCDAKNLIVCYEDDAIVQETAIDLLEGKLKYKGTLPVSVCNNFPFGFGLNE